jgi:sarcosine oxidase/L-pipecolate oxidase
MTVSSVPTQVIVIGAGVFGLSTALALAERYPSTKVHVIDRFEPPVVDGTSVDTTRCLRYDYVNHTYAELAIQSMEKIKRDPEVSKFFRPCGMTFVYDGTHDKWHNVWEQEMASVSRNSSQGPDNTNPVIHNTAEAVFQNIHGSSERPVSSELLGRKHQWCKGYTNNQDGFIDAKKSIDAYYKKCLRYPSITFTFKEVKEIVYEEDTVTAEGVKLVDGQVITGDLVVIAAGAWSCKLVDLEGMCNSTGIEVSWIKVTKEEEEQWKNMSITTNLSTGINIFPPHEGEVKILRRSPGYKNTTRIVNPNLFERAVKPNVEISYPRTVATYPQDWIPLEAEKEIRENLKEIMPSLYNRPFDRTKLCWITQTTNSNFIIDYHPKLEKVLLATGGSAHAWKFIPVIGDKIVDFMVGQLEPTLRDMWSWNEKIGADVDNRSASRLSGESTELHQVVRIAPTY